MIKYIREEQKNYNEKIKCLFQMRKFNKIIMKELVFEPLLSLGRVLKGRENRQCNVDNVDNVKRI